MDWFVYMHSIALGIGHKIQKGLIWVEGEEPL